jgi:hypothetical protein
MPTYLALLCAQPLLAKMLITCITTAVPDASSSAPGASIKGIGDVESRWPPRRTVGVDELVLGGESRVITLGWLKEFSKRVTVLFGRGSR